MIAPYPHYRDWHGSWLPQVPSHWRTGALRHFITFETGWTPPTQDDAAYTGDHKWANISDLGPRTLMDTAKHLSDAAVAGHSPVPTGALLFSFKLSVGAVSRAGAEMFTNEAIAAFRGSGEVDLRYAYYAFPEFIPRNANTNIYGAQLLNGSLIRHAPLALPPLEEQRIIADYLDCETAKIDTLIEEQQQLIEMLRERRRGIVHHLLTPRDGWSTQRVKHVASTNLGKMLDGGRSIRPDETVTPYVRAADVRADGSVNLSDLNEMPFSADELGHYDLCRGDILVIEGGATVGRPGFLHDEVPGVAFQKTVNRVRVRGDTDARLVYWALLTLYDSGFYSSYYGAVSFVHLTGEKLREIPLSLPHPEEQRRIALHLDAATAKIDTLIEETERFMNLAKERRAALITAAVTGQIDVRDEVCVGLLDGC